ncbi:MAG: outer membrane beta-barrel protein [Reichenbachiella sp.]
MKQYIIKRTTLLFTFIISFGSLSFGQLSTETKKMTPDLPGEILVDFGFNFARSEPSEMDFNWFRSKSLGVYFVKPFDIGKNMSFRPGIGISMEKLGTTDEYTIGYVENTDGSTSLEFVPIPGDVTKSQLALNFIEVPVELRYNFGGNKGKGGFYLGLGGAIGFMVDGHTKTKYEYLGRKIKTMSYDEFSFNKTRLGVSGRIGFRGFGLFYKYYFSEVFNSGSPAGTEDLAYSTIGLTVSGF